MKKAAIVTMKEISPNYGNTLQNYAVHKILKKLNIDNKTICFDYRKRSEFKVILQVLFEKAHIGFVAKKLGSKGEAEALKASRFLNFYRKYIPVHYISDINRLNDKYDLFFVGSDQVWNYTWFNESRKTMYLLKFADDNKKLCIAPSFGLDEITPQWEDYFRTQLMTFKNLCVREKAGAEIIKKLTGRDAFVMIDPTLMLQKKDWQQIVKKPKGIDTGSKYIFTYFLGDLSKERQEYINNLANKYGMKVYSIMDRNNTRLYSSDPGEFLYMLSNSELVLTDSFHACVFSFVFDRPFLVFDREGCGDNMFSRIENLLEMLSLKRKYIGSGLDNDLFECNYKEGKTAIDEQRKKAVEFIKKSIEDCKL